MGNSFVLYLMKLYRGCIKLEGTVRPFFFFFLFFGIFSLEEILLIWFYGTFNHAFSRKIQQPTQLT